jgi:uncharacterized protein YodC (DUF2158 family)
MKNIQNKFNPGDIVRLVSGDPKMVIEKVYSKDIICTWFVGNDVYRNWFYYGSLVLDNKNEY